MRRPGQPRRPAGGGRFVRGRLRAGLVLDRGLRRRIDERDGGVVVVLGGVGPGTVNVAVVTHRDRRSRQP
jgi:hypothetical protein